MSNFECPYCKADLEEPEDCHSEDKGYEWVCPICDKNFKFNIGYSKYFNTWKLDCAEHDHDYVVIGNFTTTAGIHQDVFECSKCDKIINKAVIS